MGGTQSQNLGKSDEASAANVERSSVAFRDVCGKCGAVRIDRQLGLEKTPEEYVANMVAVFREVRRVLRDDGTLWLNLGDSYYAGGWECRRVNAVGNGSMPPEQRKSGMDSKIDGLKPKDLVGIHWMVAFALRADGWYLRQDIIWGKPNPMPESVTDRCTKAHEYVFLLSKSGRYYYDATAIAEEAAGVSGGSCFGKQSATDGVTQQRQYERPEYATRNKRSVWTVPTKNYSEAHFATFPPKLIEPCVLAGCPEGGTVLDPFGGSGTTAGVANALGRRAILCELSEEYAKLVPSRVKSIVDGYFGREKPKTYVSTGTRELFQ